MSTLQTRRMSKRAGRFRLQVRAPTLSAQCPLANCSPPLGVVFTSSYVVPGKSSDLNCNSTALKNFIFFFCEEDGQRYLVWTTSSWVTRAGIFSEKSLRPFRRYEWRL